jgi:hypothetical protein
MFDKLQRSAARRPALPGTEAAALLSMLPNELVAGDSVRHSTHNAIISAAPTAAPSTTATKLYQLIGGRGGRLGGSGALFFLVLSAPGCRR